MEGVWTWQRTQDDWSVDAPASAHTVRLHGRPRAVAPLMQGAMESATGRGADRAAGQAGGPWPCYSPAGFALSLVGACAAFMRSGAVVSARAPWSTSVVAKAV